MDDTLRQVGVLTLGFAFGKMFGHWLIEWTMRIHWWLEDLAEKRRRKESEQ